MALGFDSKVPLAAATANCRRLADSGTDVSLAFEAIERGIHRPDGEVTPDANLDLAPNGHAVGVWPQSDECQKDDVFE